MRYWKSIIILLIFLLPGISIASARMGVNFSYPLITTDPDHLHGYQLMLSYDPQILQWKQLNIYFDGGFSHFWTNNTPYYRVLNIISAAPVVRIIFIKRTYLTPYFELSIGAAYLNHTRFDTHNLGAHLAFQDRIGMGAFVGAHQQFSLGVHALHYSNASLCSHNRGVSVPLMLDVGYRFG